MYPQQFWHKHQIYFQTYLEISHGLMAIVCQIGDGNNGALQTFTINVTNLPPQGANYRVKTTANQNWYNSPTQTLSLGINTITVNAVNFERTVKFQFSSGDVEFDLISLNGPLSMEDQLRKAYLDLVVLKILGVLERMFVLELKLVINPKS